MAAHVLCTQRLSSPLSLIQDYNALAKGLAWLVKPSLLSFHKAHTEKAAEIVNGKTRRQRLSIIVLVDIALNVFTELNDFFSNIKSVSKVL